MGTESTERTETPTLSTGVWIDGRVAAFRVFRLGRCVQLSVHDSYKYDLEYCVYCTTNNSHTMYVAMPMARSSPVSR